MLMNLLDDKVKLVDTREFAPKLVENLTQICNKAQEMQKKDAASISQLKLTVFRLQTMLEVDMFAEEFIVSRGLEVLMQIITDFTEYRNIQSYALTSLSRTMIYYNALNYLRTQTNIVEMLLRFLQSDNVVIIRRALSTLLILIQFLHDGYIIISDCALKLASENFNYVNPLEDEIESKRISSIHQDAVYADLVSCLSHGDVDIKYNALSLINLMIEKAELLNVTEKQKICRLLASVGVIDNLIKISQNKPSIKMKKLLSQFQSSIETVLPPSELDVWVLNAHVRGYKKIIAQKNDTIEQLAHKLEIVPQLTRELSRYHRILTDAYDSGLLLDVCMPDQRDEVKSNATHSLSVSRRIQEDVIYHEAANLVHLRGIVFLVYIVQNFVLFLCNIYFTLFWVCCTSC